MVFSVSLSTLFPCSLTRAFKTPILCDVTKVHTGFWIMPRVTHCTDDQDWGKPGSTKKVFVAKSLTQPGGFASIDRVLERTENVRWRFEVTDFQAWMLGFHKFVAEWKTTAIRDNETLVEYTYELHSNQPMLYPLNWLFAKLFWKTYMRQAVENVRKMAMNNEPYLFD